MPGGGSLIDSWGGRPYDAPAFLLSTARPRAGPHHTDSQVVARGRWPTVKGLEAEVRMLQLELELIEERRLTLPPGQLPGKWDQRRREARRRAQRLGTARSNLRRARWRRRTLRILTCGLLSR